MKTYTPPTPDFVSATVKKLKSKRYKRYFYSNLENPHWAQLLYEAGQFSNPPPLIKEDEGFRFQDWPELEYLSRVAEQVPEIALEVICSIETDNDAVRGTAIKIAAKLPPQMSLAFFKAKLGWFTSPPRFFLTEHETRNWCISLAKQGSLKDALLIADKTLLNVYPGDEKHKVITWSRDDWRYQDNAAKISPLFIAGVPKDYLNILVFKLANVIKYKFKDEEHGSVYWHRAIEEHSQNKHQHEPENTLVKAIRDAAIAIVNAEKETGLKYVLSLTSKHSSDIFTRLHIHICGETGVGVEDLVKGLIKSPENFWSVHLHHEIHQMLSKQFANLTVDTQTEVLNFISSGPPESEEPSRSAQIQRKLLIIQTFLTGKYLVLFEELKKQIGEIEHPDFHLYIDVTWVGPTSPLTPEEMTKKTPQEIVQFLQSWKPTQGWREASPRGFARLLEGEIDRRPGIFLQHILDFKSVDPTYLSSIFATLRRLKEHPWTGAECESVLQLIEGIVSQPVEIDGREVEDSFEEDPSWQWTRQQIASFLHAQVRRYPLSSRGRIWKVLDALLKDNDPSPESEKRSIEGNSEPYTIAINSTRGEAIQAAIEYGLWVRNNDKADLLKELFVAFDQLLKTDTLYSTRAVFAVFYPWIELLSNEWAEEVKDNVFQLDDKEMFYAAWVSYINFCEPYNKVFSLLEDLYLFAVKDAPNYGGKRDTHYFSRLAEHTNVFYLRGLIPLNSELMGSLLGGALLPDAIGSMGRALAHEEPFPKDFIKRALELWDFVKTNFCQGKLSNECKEALGEFGWWFSSQHLPAEWQFENLAFCISKGAKLQSGHVMERMAALAPTYPVEVLQLTLDILKQHALEYFPSLGEEEIKYILETTADSGEPDIKVIRNKLITALWEAGLEKFRPYFEK